MRKGECAKCKRQLKKCMCRKVFQYSKPAHDDYLCKRGRAFRHHFNLLALISEDEREGFLIFHALCPKFHEVVYIKPINHGGTHSRKNLEYVKKEKKKKINSPKIKKSKEGL